MKTYVTSSQYLAEAQAKEISRQCGVAYVQGLFDGYLATVSRGLYAIAKFENGKQVAL